jgi:hypothetical protein
LEGLTVPESSKTTVRMGALRGSQLEVPLTSLGDFADDLAAMGWDLETVSETDLEVLGTVLGSVSQNETGSQTETRSQIETERMVVSLN